MARFFPPKSLIMGSPAKVVRELSDEEVQGLIDHAKHYVEYKNEYTYKLKKKIDIISVYFFYADVVGTVRHATLRW